MQKLLVLLGAAVVAKYLQNNLSFQIPNAYLIYLTFEQYPCALLDFIVMRHDLD